MPHRHPRLVRWTLALAALAALPGCGTRTEVADRDVKGLVAAIQAANANPGSDVIHLAKGGLYLLRDAPRDATTLLPPITDDLRIRGGSIRIWRQL